MNKMALETKLSELKKQFKGVFGQMGRERETYPKTFPEHRLLLLDTDILEQFNQGDIRWMELLFKYVKYWDHFYRDSTLKLLTERYQESGLPASIFADFMSLGYSPWAIKEISRILGEERVERLHDIAEDGGVVSSLFAKERGYESGMHTTPDHKQAQWIAERIANKLDDMKKFNKKDLQVFNLISEVRFTNYVKLLSEEQKDIILDMGPSSELTHDWCAKDMVERASPENFRYYKDLRERLGKLQNGRNYPPFFEFLEDPTLEMYSTLSEKEKDDIFKKYGIEEALTLLTCFKKKTFPEYDFFKKEFNKGPQTIKASRFNRKILEPFISAISKCTKEQQKSIIQSINFEPVEDTGENPFYNQDRLHGAMERVMRIYTGKDLHYFERQDRLLREGHSNSISMKYAKSLELHDLAMRLGVDDTRIVDQLCVMTKGSLLDHPVKDIERVTRIWKNRGKEYGKYFYDGLRAALEQNSVSDWLFGLSLTPADKCEMWLELSKEVPHSTLLEVKPGEMENLSDAYSLAKAYDAKDKFKQGLEQAVDVDYVKEWCEEFMSAIT